LAELDVIDTTEGCVLYDDNRNEVCILILRKKALSRKGKKDFKKHLSLMKLLMKEEKGVERSKARKGIAEKEVAVGLKTNRAGHGYVESSLKKKILLLGKLSVIMLVRQNMLHQSSSRKVCWLDTIEPRI